MVNFAGHMALFCTPASTRLGCGGTTEADLPDHSHRQHNPSPAGQQPDMAAFGHVVATPLRELLAFYLGKRGGAKVPKRSSISPVDFRNLLSGVFLYEYDRASNDFQVRLAGNDIREMVQTVRQGSRIDEMFPPEAAAAVRERYARVCNDICVMHNIGQVFEKLGGTGHGERIALPLADDAGDVRFLIGATVYDLARPAEMRPGAEKVRITFTPL